MKGNTLVKYKGKNEAEVVVPEGITLIGEKAFEDCKTIERVILPDTLKTIGAGAFFASGIKSIDIPDGVETIDKLAFCCCRKLEKVTLGASVKYIGKSAFDAASALTSVTFNDVLSEIGEDAFCECKSLISVNLPRGLKKLSKGMFKSCYKLRGVVLPSSLVEIGENAFWYASLTDFVIPASVKVIGGGAFTSCDITTFKTEEGSPFHVVDGCLIDTASKKLITGCSKSVIPSDGSVTSIAAYAFSGGDYDGYPITIPLAITAIEESAFSSCQSLVIHCEEDEDDEPVGWENQWYEHPEPWDEGWPEDEITVVKWGCMPPSDRAEKNRKIREAKETAERFRLSQLNDYVRENGIMTKYVGNGGEIVIPPDVKIVLAHAFDDCDNITSVKIHYFVEFFETNAFERFKDAEFYFQADKPPRGFGKTWYKEENLHFNCVTEAEQKEIDREFDRRKKEYLALRGFEVQGEYLRKYNGCDEHVVLPCYDVKTVDKSAFEGNTKIKSVHFGSIYNVWDDAFRDCINLEKVVMPDTLTVIHSSLFQNCTKLNIEHFPVLLNEVGALALYNTALEEINLDLKFVGNGAFSHCEKLTKAVISNDGYCDLRWQSFRHCFNLKEVELNFDSSEIEWGMFDGCHRLSKIKFPRGLKKIGAMAFKDCNLYDIELPETLQDIGRQAFLNCGNMGEIKIPASVSRIGDGAFMGCTFKRITLPACFKKDMERIFGRKEPDPFGFDDPDPIINFI